MEFEDTEYDSRELSHYGSSLANLQDLDMSPNLEKIRVLHCENLTSMNELWHLTQLIEINLSSNSIARIEGLHHMANLTLLNLSCNKIRVINGLQNLYSLEKLNLSFNKISSLGNLRQLYGCNNFTHFDIRGNNISQLTELQYLRGCQHLTDLSLHGGAGTNSIVRQSEYQNTVQRMLPNLLKLDSKELRLESMPPEKENTTPEASPERVKKAPRSPIREEETKTPSPKKQPAPEIPEKPQAFYPEHLDEIRKLQHEKEEMFSQCKELQIKFETEERFYKERFSRQENELDALTRQLRDAEAEARSLAKESQFKTQNIQTLQNELGNVNARQDNKDKLIGELHEKISSLMIQVSQNQSVAHTAESRIESESARVRQLELESSNLRAQLKQAEGTLQSLHVQSLESSNSFIAKYDTLQERFDSATKTIGLKEDEIAGLKQKNNEILALNAKFDENWSQKYDESLRNKDMVIEKQRRELEDIVALTNTSFQGKLMEEKEASRQAIAAIEKEFLDRFQSEREGNRQMKNEFENLAKENVDLKELLKLAVDKEAKSQDFITELTEVIKQLQVEFDKSQSEKVYGKAEFEGVAKELGEEIARQGNEINRLRNMNVQLQEQASEAEGSLQEKTRQLTLLRREVTESTDSLDDARKTIATLRQKLKQEEENANVEMDDLGSRNKELELTLGTKNAIIEDQSEVIRSLKDKIQGFESELSFIKENKSTYREEYKIKLNDAYDEIEQLKSKLGTTELEIHDLAETNKEIQEKYKLSKEDMTKAHEQLKEKGEMITYIEDEIKQISEQSDKKSRRALADKDKIIGDLKNFRDELNSSLIAKNAECKQSTESINRLEQEKVILVNEVRTLQGRVSETEQEMRIVLMEMDKQKQDAQDKLKQLTSLFS